MAIFNRLFLSSLFLLLSTSINANASSNTNTISQFVGPQNAVRAQLGLPPLQWSKQLASYARWYGDQRRGDCALVHSGSDYGENLFWGEGKGWKIADAVAAWAGEKRNYDYKSNACVGNVDCLHYTQIVWRDSKRVGCARVACNSGDTYIVCEYDPHGNVIGQRPY